MAMSIPQQKKIFARATPHESTMSRAKIALAAARSDATGEGSLGLLAPRPVPGAEHAAAVSTMAAAQRSTARAAVRGRSAWLSLVPRHPGPLKRLEPVFASCTPARSGAEMMDCQCSPRRWVRGVVLAGTGSELCQNREVTEIVGELRPVLGFSRQASRDARGRVYAHARAYRGGEKHRTTEPVNIIHINQFVNGSDAVLMRFWPEPAYAFAVEMAENRGFRVKYWAETAVSIAPSWLTCASGDEKGGADAKVSAAKIGRSAGAAGGIAQAEGVALADLDQVQRVGGNGGNAWVSRVAHGPVGTAMLERGAQRRRNAWVRKRRRQLDRLTAGGALASDRRGAGAARPAQAGGVAPPSAAHQILRPLAHAIFPVSAESHFHACPCGLSEALQGFVGQIGSGWKWAPFGPRPQTGRGVSAKCGLRRLAYRSGGGVHVN
jgi:hypothetical protein